jgi:hypothetical protein
MVALACNSQPLDLTLAVGRLFELYVEEIFVGESGGNPRLSGAL